MAVVYLGLGTNLGDKDKNLKAALHLINERIGEVTSLSSFWATEPWGFVSDNGFLNAAAEVITTLSPEEILEITQQVEKELGRMTKSADGHYTDRLIDVDILMYDDRILRLPDLSIPHPLMEKRSFVMNPLAEIAPEVQHPVLHKSMKELADALTQS